MKSSRFTHIAVDSVEEAAMVLDDTGADARLIAGGQSLIPMLSFRLSAPALLVDLNRVPELFGITELESGGLQIGAMTRHRSVETSQIVATHLPLLALALPHVAHLAIRNRGTIGGSLAHADPAAELPALALVHDATMILRNRRGQRTVAAADFFTGVFSTALAADEILTEVRFPQWPGSRRFAFREFSRRRGDFALAGVAFWADMADRQVQHCRIVAFGVSDRPQRLHDAEAALKGRSPEDPACLAEVAVAAQDALAPDGDIHASAGYRRDLAVELLRRAMADALREDQP